MERLRGSEKGFKGVRIAQIPGDLEHWCRGPGGVVGGAGGGQCSMGWGG
jgi:hypothetical protein